MPNFVVTTVHGPGWDDAHGIREQRGWDEHAAFMDGLVTDGFLLLGGPLDDGRQTMHLVQAEDADAVRRCFAADPWVRAGLLEYSSIRTWTLWLDSRSVAT